MTERATCPECGDSVSVRTNGKLRAHGPRGADPYNPQPWCPGSWTQVLLACPECGRVLANRQDGTLRRHTPERGDGEWCAGSEQPGVVPARPGRSIHRRPQAFDWFEDVREP